MIKVPALWVMACLICGHVCRMNSAQPSYNPQFMYLLNCGAAPNSSVLVENRQWVSDNPSSPFLSSTIPSISANSTITSDMTIPPSSPLFAILSTARIFTSPTSYSFPITAGRCWIRLYFFPFPYQQFDPSLAVFSVTAASYTLIFNIDVLDTIRSSSLNSNYLFKEYSINATGASLVLTFIPNSADGSFAFVNAIEVLSMPSNIFTDDTSPLGVNTPAPIGMPYMALETICRLNVGGPAVTPVNDTQGLFRTWLPNETFLLSPVGVESISTATSSIIYKYSSSMLIAPPIVYSTALQMNFSPAAYPQGLNLSYALPIQGSYQYVIRLHFCEFVYGTGGKRLFNVYLQNQTAYANLDLQLVQPGQGQAYYRDISLRVDSGESTLWIQAGPPPNSSNLDFNKAILSGIEIWKLNNSYASLDGLGATPPPNSSPRSMLRVILGSALGGMLALSLLLMVGIFLLKHFRSRQAAKKDAPEWVPLSMLDGNSENPPNKTSLGSQKSSVTGSSSKLGRHFTLAEMLEATSNFDESRVLGIGGFGKVYLGELDDGTKAAVKRGSRGSQQGITEFQTEIDMLSKLRHRHLVSLIGHCEEQNEMILVYEYMARGTLRSHLYGSNLAPLPWKRRLEICIGATRGIHYLHTGAAQSIIHRDVKTTNILLDENFVAKMSDFGLSKTGPALDQTHVSTVVKGSFGYLDPEYFRRQQLTEKSDIYSLGMVLLEVLCARPPINLKLSGEQVNLAEYALHCKSRGMLKNIVDPHVAGTIDGKCLRKFVQIAESCLAEEGVNRPAIGDVLWNLEHALQLQEGSTMQEAGVSIELSIMEAEAGQGSSGEAGRPREEEGEEDMRAVFSQFVVPQGR